MDTCTLVNRFNNIKHLSQQKQCNVLQLSRNYAFEHYRFGGYCLRFLILPIVIILVAMGAPWLFIHYSDMRFLVVSVTTLPIAYLLDKALYIAMFNCGLCQFIDKPATTNSET